MTQPAEDPLVSQAFDAKKHEDLARAIEQLSPDEAAFFLHKLEMAIRKRKIQITGHRKRGSSVVLALTYFGMHDGFVGWVFLAPFGSSGDLVWIRPVGRDCVEDAARAGAQAGP